VPVDAMQFRRKQAVLHFRKIWMTQRIQQILVPLNNARKTFALIWASSSIRLNLNDDNGTSRSKNLHVALAIDSETMLQIPY